MPLPTLDPKLDVVFRRLFTDPHNRGLLTHLLTAILQPRQPICGVTVLNPDLQGSAIGERGAIVDLLVEHDGGHRVHVEMQLAHQRDFVKRALFYWARAYAGQLRRGQGPSVMQPTAGIFILNYDELPTRNYHSRFRLLETRAHDLLTDVLDLHFLELRKIPTELAAAPNSDPVLNWAQFFAAQTDAARHAIAMTDPTIALAEDALKQLSEDQIARDEAFKRALEIAAHQDELKYQREEGRQEGRQEGAARQRLQTLGQLCALFDIELSDSRRQQAERSSALEFDQLLAQVVQQRAWPE